MGAKLMQYYGLAEQKGGLPLKMRLAMKTGVPSTNAQAEPDSPENLAKFYAAAKEIIGADVPQL
jgi:hypothetical protein